MSLPLSTTVAAEAAGRHEPTRASIDSIMDWIATAIEVAGVTVIVAGIVIATALFLHRGFATAAWADAFPRYRANLGRGILLGLELLVAADIIGTVAVEPSFTSLGVLGLIVLIRTFLSVSLGVEIEGRWPWARAEAAGATSGTERGRERL